MARIKVGVTAHRRHKHILELAKGYRGAKHLIFSKANETVMKGLMYSAKHLHKIGRPEIALRVLDKVGKQYPNSLVSAECRTESLRIEAEQVVVEQGPKQ